LDNGNGAVLPYYCLIPAEVLLDGELKHVEKILYGCIAVFATRNGYSTLSNETMAEWFGVNVATVSGWLGDLEARSYLSIRSRTHAKRKLYPMVAMGRRRAQEVPEDAEPGLPEDPQGNFLEKAAAASPRKKEAASPHSFFRSMFFQLHRETRGYDPPWSGKEARLLKLDLERMQSVSDINPDENWSRLFSAIMQLFFRDKVKKVADFCASAGYGYSVLHSQIDSIMVWLDKKKEGERSERR
jgi:DNA-binding PadR family transcriptional regulator